MNVSAAFDDFSIAGTSTVEWWSLTWRRYAMKADNVVTTECSVEVEHVVTSASSSHLGLKPSKFIGLVPCHLMPAEKIV